MARDTKVEIDETVGVSECLCGHVGDVPSGPKTLNMKKAEKQHAGLLGHGACMVPGCTCQKFSWKKYLK